MHHQEQTGCFIKSYKQKLNPCSQSKFKQGDREARIILKANGKQKQDKQEGQVRYHQSDPGPICLVRLSGRMSPTFNLSSNEMSRVQVDVKGD